MINIVLWMPQTHDEVMIEFHFELKHIPNELCYICRWHQKGDSKYEYSSLLYSCMVIINYEEICQYNICSSNQTEQRTKE